MTADRQLEAAMGDGVKRVEDNERQSAIVQRRALYTARDLKAGEILQETDVTAVRPIREGAIPPYELDTVLGKALLHDVPADSYLRREDIAE